MVIDNAEFVPDAARLGTDQLEDPRLLPGQHFLLPYSAAQVLQDQRQDEECQAQEAGLPRRITGAPEAWADDRGARREVVIENDIAWRIHAMVIDLCAEGISFRATKSSCFFCSSLDDFGLNEITGSRSSVLENIFFSITVRSFS